MNSIATSPAATRPPASVSPDDVVLKQAVFDRFVHGLLVVDGEGRVLCGNRAALGMLRPGGATCCAFLGCEEAGDCPTRHAVTGSVVAELRRDVPGPTGPRAIWVSASALSKDPVRVLLQLRPGDIDDRRRRADPTWRAAQKLHIATFGRIAIARGGTITEGGWLDQRTGDLLRFLIVRRERAVTADEIGESLWRAPGYNVARNVRTCVHRLRAALEPGRNRHQAPAYLLTRGGSYRLNLHHVEIDADVFEARLKRGTAMMDSDPAAAASTLEGALALYRGELFAEVPYAGWALAERARLHELACNGLQRLTRLHRVADRPEEARRSLERLAALQPLDETVCRELIELDIACGRHSDAKRRYDRLAHMMRESLGYQPAFALADLAPVTEP